MTLYFTADTHFGHSNILRYDKRPFADVNEMNEALITNWNRAVNPTDSVYHLGDVSMLRPERTREILDRLNGRIYLIRGNHDRAAEHKLCRDRFEWIKDYHFLKLDGGVMIALMHYAMRIWDRHHHGAWHLYGHSHGRLNLPQDVLALDVGVDSWEFMPVALQTIKTRMVERGWTGRALPVNTESRKDVIGNNP